MPNRVIEKINLSLHQSSILRNSCPPDIIGADYYVIFERHLDENVSRYPEGYRIQGFADVPVVHVNRSAEWDKNFGSGCWRREGTVSSVVLFLLHFNMLTKLFPWQS